MDGKINAETFNDAPSFLFTILAPPIIREVLYHSFILKAFNFLKNYMLIIIFQRQFLMIK